MKATNLKKVVLALSMGLGLSVAMSGSVNAMSCSYILMKCNTGIQTLCAQYMEECM